MNIYSRKAAVSRWSQIVVALSLVGLIGCGKVPTWNELTTGQSAPPPPNKVVPGQATPAGPHVGPQTEDPAQIIAWFKGLPPMQISDQSIARVTSVKTGLAAIREINANSSIVTDAGLADLSKLPGLEKLSLDNTPITNEGLKALQRVPSLQSLTLNSTRVSAAGLQPLAALSGLKRLELMSVHLAEADFEAISKLPALEVLYLSRVMELNDAGLDLVCQASNLKSLYLDECLGLTDKGLGALAKAPGLEELSLAKTSIVGVGIGNASSKGGLKALKSLTVSYAPITLVGAKAINSVKSLETLNIDHIPGMNDAGLVEFVEGMKDLKSLNIEASKGIVGVSFGKMKATAGSLEQLNAKDTGINDQALGLLKNHKQLKFIDLSNTSVSLVAVQQFKRLVPTCELLYAGTRY